jgi:2-C-methyl-D-erythritol 4-phosphate cytidylyltransferase/2-C-methyl-D-erythritol 2,4-cyclodiphosphate synthase
VLFHYAARPGLAHSVFRELFAALDSADAAAPALPLTDALKDIGDKVMRTVSRDRLVRVQTPQAFRFDTISKAIAGARDAAVDDLALVEASGARVVLTPGRPELMKITHPEDMAIAEKLLSGPAMRVGTGFDVHGFVAGDGVTICGVVIPHTKKLEGHSDADVGWHALTDAILGAAALGDIGDHFPPSDPKWKGANSLVFLQHAAKLAGERGFKVVNADITLMCEKPKIAPHREAMRAKTAEALTISIDAVSVKATTTEKLGFLGREEGIAAQAVVLLSR